MRSRRRSRHLAARSRCLVSQEPPAEPGAFKREPLKAAADDSGGAGVSSEARPPASRVSEKDSPPPLCFSNEPCGPMAGALRLEPRISPWLRPPLPRPPWRRSRNCRTSPVSPAKPGVLLSTIGSPFGSKAAVEPLLASATSALDRQDVGPGTYLKLETRSSARSTQARIVQLSKLSSPDPG